MSSPHTRNRHVESLLRRTLRFSPIAGLFGHRQVGKTTLSSRMGTRYFSMDLPITAAQVNQDPLRFLRGNSGNPLVLDECQLTPDLFPALKEWVREFPKPGQFLLTGSVRFSSRKQIRESLTGRIVAWQLVPMDLSEICQTPLPDIIPAIFNAKSVDLDLPPASKDMRSIVGHYLERGGLPGIISVRDSAVRAQRFETQLETQLEKDLRLVTDTTLSFPSLRNFVVFLANHQGQPFEYALASRTTRISIPTLRKILAGLESIFFIRFVQTEGGEKRSIVYLEDQGEATHLRTRPPTDVEDLERFLFANLRHQWIYRPQLGLRLTQYRTRGGAYVPLVLKSKNGALGIMPIPDESPNAQAIGSGQSFLKRTSRSKLIYVHLGRKDRILDKNQRILGVASLLSRSD